jgi:hypothetical protein
MAKLLCGWVLLSTSGFVMLGATYSNQTPLLVGSGMLLLGAVMLDTDGPRHKKKEHEDE